MGKDMSSFIIGVGTSYPRGEYFIQRAYQELELCPQVRMMAQSKLYPNPAFGGQTLFGFINTAFKLETNLHPDALWFLILSIENKLGRVRLSKNGPRTIDLDILWSSLGSIQTPYLTVPHPELRKRPFAFKPASDIGLP